jgi:thiol-disulfide isomerase/thioredoxin
VFSPKSFEMLGLGRLDVLGCLCIAFATVKLFEIVVPSLVWNVSISYGFFSACFLAFQRLNNMMPRVEIGKPAATLDDRVVYVQKDFARATPGIIGKVVVIEKWATWCPPCVKSVPHLNGIYNKYKENSEFQLVAITEENDRPLIESFIRQHNMCYPVAIDTTGTIARDYPSMGIPNATIIGKDGLIFWNGHPMSIDEPLHLVMGY